MKEHAYVFGLLKGKQDEAGFKALTAVTIKSTLLWVVTLCGLEAARRCGETYTWTGFSLPPAAVCFQLVLQFDPKEASDVFSWAEISLPAASAGL
jgi:hypothetical protein